MTDKDNREFPELCPEDLELYAGGSGTAEKQTAGGRGLTCPICQCPNLTWQGRKYTCTECGYQGYA